MDGKQSKATDKERQLLVESGKRLLRENLAAGTWGNISCRLGQNQMLITPGGANYETLRPEDMVPVDLDNLHHPADQKPSSEHRVHDAIYCAHRKINAVVHIHSRYAGIAAAVGKKILPYLSDTAMLLGVDIAVVPHGFPGSEALAQSVQAALQDRYAVLLQNHGAICVGRDMEEAFTACHILEKSCQTQLTVQALGDGHPLSPQDAQTYRETYLTAYQKK